MRVYMYMVNVTSAGKIGGIITQARDIGMSAGVLPEPETYDEWVLRTGYVPEPPPRSCTTSSSPFLPMVTAPMALTQNPSLI